MFSSKATASGRQIRSRDTEALPNTDISHWLSSQAFHPGEFSCQEDCLLGKRRLGAGNNMPKVICRARAEPENRAFDFWTGGLPNSLNSVSQLWLRMALDYFFFFFNNSTQVSRTRNWECPKESVCGSIWQWQDRNEAECTKVTTKGWVPGIWI